MIEQIGIACTGVVSIALTQSKLESRRKWACIFGLVAQPFWAYSAIKAEQWGIGFMVLLYTAAWGKGFWQNWVKV